MSKDEGILIYFDERKRREVIIDRINEGAQTFSDTLSLPDWEMKQIDLALLAFSENTIDYMALVTKGRRVATAKYRVEFSELVDLGAIPLEQINKYLKSNVKHYFIRISQGVGGRIPSKTWNSVIDVIKQLCPDVQGEINRLCLLRKYSGVRFKGKTADILLQERDAVGISLDIFSGNNSLRSKVLGSWSPSDDMVAGFDEHKAAGVLDTKISSSFLSGIKEVYLQEESSLQHDLFNWADSEPSHSIGCSVFQQGKRRLEIIYANRNALENTLGVDLIYYNELYHSFILVQYKLMHKEDDEFVYRPNKDLLSELGRMQKFMSSYPCAEEIKNHAEYRLNQDGFMIKLVPNYGVMPATGELIKGMYIPRIYMNFLLSDYGPKGPRDGKIISFKNAPRYLTNSEFVNSVNRGWIGMCGFRSSVLKELIKQFYATGKSVLLAYESKIENSNEAEQI